MLTNNFALPLNSQSSKTPIAANIRSELLLFAISSRAKTMNQFYLSRDPQGFLILNCGFGFTGNQWQRRKILCFQ